MRVLRKNPGDVWKTIEIENDLQALQEAVGGYIESVTLAEDCCFIVDEEGRLKGLPYNMTVCGVDFVGPVLFVGVDGEDFTDVPTDLELILRGFG